MTNPTELLPFVAAAKSVVAMAHGKIMGGTGSGILEAGGGWILALIAHTGSYSSQFRPLPDSPQACIS